MLASIETEKVTESESKKLTSLEPEAGVTSAVIMYGAGEETVVLVVKVVVEEELAVVEEELLVDKEVVFVLVATFPHPSRFAARAIAPKNIRTTKIPLIFFII